MRGFCGQVNRGASYRSANLPKFSRFYLKSDWRITAILYRSYRSDPMREEVTGNTGPAASSGTESLLPGKECPIVNSNG